jgi:hypothetical protein
LKSRALAANLGAKDGRTRSGDAADRSRPEVEGELYDHDTDEYEWNNMAKGARYADVKKDLIELLPTTNKPELPGEGVNS